MPGNSERRGAKRNTGSKKGPTVGSGGQARRGLKGKGPTPRAEERTGHPAARRSAGARRRAGAGGSAGGGGGQGSRRPGGGGRSGPRETAEVVVGRNAVVEALRAGVPATALYVAQRIDTDDRVREALKLATNRGVPLMEVTRTEVDRLADGAMHQGVGLQVPPYDYAHPDDLLRLVPPGEVPLLVVLDGVTDPRNLGAVVRSAAAFGAHGVVVPERRAAGMTASAWKTSAGAAARLRVARATNLTRTIEAFQADGLFAVGLAAEGGISVADLEVATEPLVVVVGSEGTGLSRLVAQTCDALVRIPMAAGTESLNAGVAAGIALYEVARRRSS